MSMLPSPSRSRVLDWSLTLGGCVCLAIGSLVLLKGQQAPISRSFVFLASIFLLGMGLGNLLEPSHPEAAARARFVGKVFAGFAIFSLSWAISHP